jgi:hypothetical protein
MTQEEGHNFDLDIMSCMRGFPEDEHNGCVYMRGNIKKIDEGTTGIPTKDIGDGFVVSYTTPEIFAVMLYDFINQDADMASGAMNALLNYLKDDKEKMDMFCQHIDSIKSTQK